MTHPLHLLFCFLSGVLLMNAIPHIVHGVSGRAFQSPFASPPGRGLSSSNVNVLWGVANAVAGYAMLIWAAHATAQSRIDCAAIAIGALLSGLLLSQTFGKLHGGDRRGGQ